MVQTKAPVSDQGVLATVKTNTGEVARFSDGTTVLRLRPETNSDHPNPFFKGIHVGNLQPPHFKEVFMVGLTVFQVMVRLGDPEAGRKPGGEPGFAAPASPRKERTTFTFTATANDFKKLPGLGDAIHELTAAAASVALTFPESKRREVSKLLKGKCGSRAGAALIEHADGNLWLRHGK
jgi:hypothetical protein